MKGLIFGTSHPEVIVSRDFREYGIVRYGDGRGQGRQILVWVSENYRPAASIGGDRPGRSSARWHHSWAHALIWAEHAIPLPRVGRTLRLRGVVRNQILHVPLRSSHRVEEKAMQ